MYLHTIEKNSILSLDYMERVVNNGSQSGFTNIHSTSKDTNPFFSKRFRVLKIITDPSRVKSYGKVSIKDIDLDRNDYVFLHPDWLICDMYDSIESIGTIEYANWVIPTSSSRTVRIENSNMYLKLCYPGILGRLNRELKHHQILSGVEISNIFDNAMRNKLFPDYFDYLPETYGRVLETEKGEIGFIVREIPKRLLDFHLIPGFSLFSTDHNSINDEKLLCQILNQKTDPYTFFMDEICYPLIDVFFTCVYREGLIPEMHSQNVIYAFDANWNIKKIVLRDFESIDKDLSIRKAIGKNIDFAEYPYKCISKDDKNYLKRHSLMFDHKLCEYLIKPLVECICYYLQIETYKVNDSIKEHVKSKYKNIISSFFPYDGCWYKYPNIEIDRTTNNRPFISMGDAIYR